MSKLSKRSLVRVGLIGLGRHGLRYAHHLVQGDVPGVRLTAFWRRDRPAGEAAATGLRARFEPDLDALIEAPDVDAVVVVVPVHMHRAVAQKVTAAGKAMLIEKPLARTVAEGADICAAAEAAGSPLMVAQTLRFDPLVQALKARAAELGPIRGFAFEQRLEPRGLAWEDDPERAGGGVLIQTGIHTIDALRFVVEADPVEVVHARFARVLNRRTEDHAVVTASAGAGALGTISCSKVGASRHLRFALFHEAAGLEADLLARTLTEVVGRARVVRSIETSATIVGALEAFAALVTDDAAPNPVPGRQALASLQVVEAAYRAAHWDGAYSCGTPPASR